MSPLSLYVLTMYAAHNYQKAVFRGCLPCAHVWYFSAVALYNEFMGTVHDDCVSGSIHPQ